MKTSRQSTYVMSCLTLIYTKLTKICTFHFFFFSLQMVESACLRAPDNE